MVWTLAFDTSAAHCAAALLRGDQLVAARAEEMGRGQAERLMPLIQEVLAEGGCPMSDLDVIGVGVGPGNFTGIRISVSAARGMALALGIPAVGVSTLDATALDAERPVRVHVPAPRDQVYEQGFGCEPAVPLMRAGGTDGDTPVILPPAPAELAERIARIALTRAPFETEAPAPLYLRAADAAPAKDAPPVILP
ncbi:tRNA (adenosine(37)-N6)-threonylcarbamoyltransferase complex dimerization subunit type 1 TsaB [Donghicola sp. C2-DW-16]|uniref:tRNA (Adenosine(37)-N6)-threonylcarbamoyltransferase complex dimerization subunit type 1 TsaB n=1 Tax=Donghicola mangrovi TaxID=2729614 RepID=A0ABX2PD71_9RHOB|nr:tRNA (adenosine(37)-N6)-threonylcarbamoyltransferase complex dimerization subunit type 1 TsaB [Donghicola mangrovi]NVO26614.1 tRNA (adenosine(37)-N6)-threonylcarbamoyltransferase complex dimerization subunit type 1 TsaB [Donghicola mangrovi]